MNKDTYKMGRSKHRELPFNPLLLSTKMRAASLSFVMTAIASVAYGQTVYLAGDSTMAKGGGGSGTDGTLFAH